MNQQVSSRIYVAGLDGKVSATDLRTYFSKFGEMTDVYVPNNHQTGQPKHFGFVTFAQADSAQECLSNPMHEINGQSVELRPCVPKDQIAPKGCGKGDPAAAGVFGAVGAAAPGLGMTLPMQPGLMQPAFGALGLQPAGLQQALQQQMLLQQMQQQQLLQDFMAKMQQPQQFAPQPAQMLPGQFPGLAALPAGGFDMASAGFPAMQGMPQPFGMVPQPAIGVASTDGQTAPGAAAMLSLAPQQFAAPSLGAALGQVNQVAPAYQTIPGLPQQPAAAPLGTAPALMDAGTAGSLASAGLLPQAAPFQQAPSPALANGDQQGSAQAAAAPIQFNSAQMPAAAGTMPSPEGAAAQANLSFGAVQPPALGQESTRYAPY